MLRMFTTLMVRLLLLARNIALADWPRKRRRHGMMDARGRDELMSLIWHRQSHQKRGLERRIVRSLRVCSWRGLAQWYWALEMGGKLTVFEGSQGHRSVFPEKWGAADGSLCVVQRDERAGISVSLRPEERVCAAKLRTESVGATG